jgi:hypothetical protein
MPALSSGFECIGYKSRPYRDFIGTALFRLPSGEVLPVAVYRHGGEIYFSDHRLDPSCQPLSVGAATAVIQIAMRVALRETCPQLFIAGGGQ